MSKPLRVDLLEVATQVKPGDVAVTSGMQHSVYPPGVPVGRVVSTDTAPQSLRRTVSLAPVVDVNKLDDIAVLQWRPS